MANAQNQFTDLQKLTACTLTYEDFSARVDAIMMSMGEERENKIKEYFKELLRLYIDSGMRHRMAAEFDPSVVARGVNTRDMTARRISNDLATMFKNALAEKDPALLNQSTEHGTTPEERRDIIIDAINNAGKERSELDSLVHNGRTQKITNLSESLNELLVNFKSNPNFRFNPESSNESHTKSSALYFQYEARKAKYDEDSKKSRRWRFRNFFDRWRTRSFMKKCEKYFENIGFDKEKHGEMLRAQYASQMPEYISYEIGMAKDVCRTEIFNKEALEKMKNTEQINVARDKYEQAQELNKDPKTSFAAKVMPLVEKYNVSLDYSTGLTLVYDNYQTMAKVYDTERDFAKIQTEVKVRFNSVYGLFVSSALKNGNFDPVEVLKDVNEFATAELKYFTPLYEHADAKEFADNNLFANIPSKVFENKAINSVNIFRKKNGMEPLTEQESNEIREKISTYVNEEREKNARRIEQEQKESAKDENVVANDQNSANTEVVKEDDSVRTRITDIDLNDNVTSATAPKHEDNQKTVELSKL